MIISYKEYHICLCQFLQEILSWKVSKVLRYTKNIIAWHSYGASARR